MRPLILAALLTLTACGADGPPVTPASQKPEPDAGITITGDVTFGVSRQIN